MCRVPCARCKHREGENTIVGSDIGDSNKRLISESQEHKSNDSNNDFSLLTKVTDKYFDLNLLNYS